MIRIMGAALVFIAPVLMFFAMAYIYLLGHQKDGREQTDNPAAETDDEGIYRAAREPIPR